MKNLLFLSLLVLLSACGKSDTEFLYSEHDDEYNTVLALANEECMSKSKIFEILDKAKEFSNFKVGEIYKSVQTFKEGDTVVDSLTVRRFFIIRSIDNNRMEVELKSSDSNENSLIEFTKENANSILKTVANGICFRPEPKYGYGNLNSTSNLKFSKKREEKNEVSGKKRYKKVDEEFTIHKDYPVFMFFFNGKINFSTNESGKDVKSEYDRKFSQIDSEKCDDDSVCKDENPSKNSCRLEIDELAYDRDEVNAPLMELVGCDIKNIY